MENLDARESCFAVDEDLLNFTLEDEEPLLGGGSAAVSGSSSTLEPSNTTTETTPSSCVTQNGSHHEAVEEDLEWLSNKDAFPEVETCLFPAVETCFGILADNPELIPSNLSPISVLENSGSSSTNINRNTNVGSVSCFDSYRVPTKYPVRARGKRGRKRSGFGVMRHMPSPQFVWSIQDTMNKKLESLPPLPKMVASGMGRRCMHCQTDKTPQWRAGPNGPKTLCNACGVRYKSGRLVPEYRPASSPTFSSVLHSNSHRKVVEMRRQKQMMVAVSSGGGGGMVGPNVAAPGSGGCTVV